MCGIGIIIIDAEIELCTVELNLKDSNFIRPL
jgi:hypothetical protein